MKKPKLKTYQLTQIIYVTMLVEAPTAEHAERKLRDIINNFDTDPNNEPEYQKALAQSAYDIDDIEEIDAE